MTESASSMSSLIRVAILGLSPGSWASTAHLPYLTSKESKFTIIAVCNSSVESSQKSIKHFGLPPSTKAYGNPQDVADNGDVDLVLCTVRVDRHHATIIPSIKARKSVYVEWPLGKNLAEARELLALSKQHNVPVMAVGLQGREDSTIRTVKELLAEGKIGKVLSSSLVGTGVNGAPTEQEKYAYLLDESVGGNLLTIPFSHCLDSVQQVLGPFKSFTTVLSNQIPNVDLLNPDGTVARSQVPKTSVDHVLVQGTLDSGAVLSVHVRSGPPFKDAPGLEWHIYGSKGEVRVTAASAHVQISGFQDIFLHDHERNTVEKVEVRKGLFEEWPSVTRNVARVYERIANGAKDVSCDFEAAVARHEIVEEMMKQNGRV
ncbi:transcription regulator gal80 [Thoreauomyces humboldtii]|nr:transcription regulator gal80 [Thoreauomyces humboldtii]